MWFPMSNPISGENLSGLVLSLGGNWPSEEVIAGIMELDGDRNRALEEIFLLHSAANSGGCSCDFCVMTQNLELDP